jgi:hypothetical protein
VCKRVAECVPVTKTICTYECRPVTKTVCCYQCVTKCVPTQCTVTKCVPTCETVTCTVNTRKCVPYQATRTVCKNVCVQEKVKVCKMVAKPCAPAAPAAPANCGPACGPTSGGCDTATACCPRTSLMDKLKCRMGGLKDRMGGLRAKLCCKKNTCDTGCGSAATCGAAASCCH